MLSRCWGGVRRQRAVPAPAGRELPSIETRRVVLAPFSLHVHPVALSLQLVKAWRSKRTVAADDQGGALGTGQGHHAVSAPREGGLFLHPNSVFIILSRIMQKKEK